MSTPPSEQLRRIALNAEEANTLNRITPESLCSDLRELIGTVDELEEQAGRYESTRQAYVDLRQQVNEGLLDTDPLPPHPETPNEPLPPTPPTPPTPPPPQHPAEAPNGEATNSGRNSPCRGNSHCVACCPCRSAPALPAGLVITPAERNGDRFLIALFSVNATLLTLNILWLV